MESPTAPLDLTLGYLERSESRSPRSPSLLYHNGAIIGPMLLLTIHRKAYMASSMTLSGLERSSSRSPTILKAYIS